jgi:two-component system, cell cycle sensor histidine kinase and response regulator CckA
MQSVAWTLRLNPGGLPFSLTPHNWTSVEGGQLRPVVLVVDDDPQVRAITVRALAEAGFVTLEATNPIDALALLQDPHHHEIHLLITDIVMPGMSGDDLGRLLHRTHPTLPVLYMSGYSLPHFEFLTPDELEHCWISKPFDISELVQKAKECLVASRARS